VRGALPHEEICCRDGSYAVERCQRVLSGKGAPWRRESYAKPAGSRRRGARRWGGRPEAGRCSRVSQARKAIIATAVACATSAVPNPRIQYRAPKASAGRSTTSPTNPKAEASDGKPIPKTAGM
jgi:hypothetical protein